MAYTKGCYGKVKARTAAAGGAAVLVGELLDWNFSAQASTESAPKMGDCTERETSGPVKTTGQIVCNWDLTDATQASFDIGDVMYLEIMPGGSGSGSRYYKSGDTATGGALVTQIDRAGNGTNGIVGMTFAFTHPGDFTATSVP